MEAKLVMHFDLEDQDRVTTGLGNIDNLMREIPAESSTVVVVANSSAVRLFLRERAASYVDKVSRLAALEARFLVCNNSLKKLGIDPKALLPECEVIPAGIVELVRLQHEGFAYVKP